MPRLEKRLLKESLNLKQGRDVNVLTGNAGIDISAAVYTGFIPFLMINPAEGEGLVDCVIDIDLDKATDGVNEVATASDTVICALQTRVDGTNWVTTELMSSITLTGTAGSIADGKNGHKFKVGLVDPTGLVRVSIKLSAERADCYIPYRVTYIGATPTVTATSVA